MCKVVVLFIKSFCFVDAFVAVLSSNLKVPNLKKIGDYLHP